MIPPCTQLIGLEVPSEMVLVRITVHVSHWMPWAQQGMLHGLLADTITLPTLSSMPWYARSNSHDQLRKSCQVHQFYNDRRDRDGTGH